MSYQAVVNIIRDTANEVNPDGFFSHGRRSDFTLENDKTFPQIFLLPLSSDVDLTNNYSELYTATVMFLDKDSPDSSQEKREEIIAKMDDLCRDFVNTIYVADGFQVSGIRTQPYYREMNQVGSGYILSFRIQTTTSPC